VRQRRASVEHEERRRTAALLGLVAIIASVLLGAVALALATTGDPARRPSAIRHASLAPAPAAALPVPAASLRRRHRVALPVRIAIPRLGVRARIVRLGLNRDGTLQVPANFADTGWWSGGSRPGERGPAVIAGHVDSRTGPAVFFRIGKLRRGDTIRIGRRDGSVVRFAVQRLGRYPKARFPTKQVYGSTPRPTLRLITCSGDFDRSTGHYLDNTVVYATLVVRR
jgi:hypothetical protein